MKRKNIKALLLVTAFAVALSMCSCDKKETANNDWRLISAYNMVEEGKNGCFIITPESRLDFVDFDTCQSSPVCDGPTCTHTKDSDCVAFGKDNHPFLYNDRLYYMVQTDFVETDDGYKQSTQLWSSDINGSNAKQIYEFDGIAAQTYNTALLFGDTLYITAPEPHYDKDFNDSGSTLYLIKFSLNDEKVTLATKLTSGYSVSAYIKGVWNNKLILDISVPKDNRPYMEKIQEYAEENGVSEKNAFSQYVDNYITTLKEYDLSNDKLSDSDLEYPMLISSSHYLYVKDNKLYSLSTDGEAKDICDFSEVAETTQFTDGCYIRRLDGGDYLFDYENDALTEINDVPEGCTVLGRADNQLIVKEQIITDETTIDEIKEIEIKERS